MSKRKTDAKAFAAQKRKRRQWLTFVRMCRYGVNNFSRNAWLTLAATAVMTITLLIMFVTFAASSVLNDSVEEIQKKVDVSIYLKADAPQEDVDTLLASIKKLSTVRTASFVSPDEGRKKIAIQNGSDAGTLNALNEAEKNSIPGLIRVNLSDINKPEELKNFVDKSDVAQKYLDPYHPPSYTTNQKVTRTIGSWIDFAQKFGLVASVIFVAISSLIIFNTIRMAIFNRRDEIQMMKLIGADRSFIRGPFLVEAMVYGFIAGVVATGIGLAILYAIRPKLEKYGVAVGDTIDHLTLYVGVVLIVMIIVGAIIGVVSSLLATRRYLKI